MWECHDFPQFAALLATALPTPGTASFSSLDSILGQRPLAEGLVPTIAYFRALLAEHEAMTG